jgi:hypothetical protein
VFRRVNALYISAYKRHIDSAATEIDEINPKEFSEASVKVVVQQLQAISITKGAARHGILSGRSLKKFSDQVSSRIEECISLTITSSASW